VLFRFPSEGKAMNIRHWKGFLVVCSGCGHRNRPSKSPREGIRLALLDQLPDCRGCGKPLRCDPGDRPLARQVRAELALAQAGQLVAAGAA